MGLIIEKNGVEYDIDEVAEVVSAKSDYYADKITKMYEVMNFANMEFDMEIFDVSEFAELIWKMYVNLTNESNNVSK